MGRTSVVAVVLCLSSAAAAAQAPVPVAGMPPASRIEAEVHGTDPMDTAARRMGAFWQLQQIVKTMAGVRYWRNQLTKEEGRILGEYAGGYQRAAKPYEHIANDTSHPDRSKWHLMHSRYEQDPAFRAELIERFCSPDIRAAYMRAKAEEDAKDLARSRAAAAAREQGGVQLMGPNPGGPPSSSANDPFLALMRGGGAARPSIPTAAPGTVDPDILTARSANVDTKVFGIPLGEPLQLPFCQGTLFQPDARTCVVTGGAFESMANDIARELLGVETDPNVVSISLAKESCPGWMAGCSFTALLHDGLLVAVALPTAGRFVENKVKGELRVKYGREIGNWESTIHPNAGEPFKTQNPEWLLSGLRVEYRVVGTGVEGPLANDQGLVRIETASAHHRRTARQRELEKPKL